MRRLLLAMTLNLFATACLQAQSDLPFDVEPVTSVDEPWALAFLPDGAVWVLEGEEEGSMGRLLKLTPKS